jgi:dimethylargininase
MFTSAIVKTPCRNMVHGISGAGLGIPDYELALVQHREYIEALQSIGLTVTVLEADESFPDSTFIEDTCLITPRCAVIMNPGAASRKDEVIAVRNSIETIGRPTQTIHFPGTVDAGDIMMVGDTFYVGLSGRTNQEGVRQLDKILNRYDYNVIPVTLDRVLHLKTGVSYLENNTLLACGEFLAEDAFQPFNILQVPTEEAYAANSVWINGTVIVPEGFERTLNLISDAGYSPLTINVSEFQKLDGGLSCLSLRF